MIQIPGAAETIKKLLSRNKKVIFVTNNSTKNRETIKDCIDRVLGIDMPVQFLYSSGIALASYLKERINPGEKVYLMGTDDLSKILDKHDIDHIGVGSDMDPCSFHDWDKFIPDPCVKYVIGSFDPYFNYTKLVKAYIYIKECAAKFIVTNQDIVYPTSKDRTVPGTGSLLSGLTNAVEAHPTVVGKPSSTYYDIIRKEHNITDADKVLMVGDNLHTDIQFGINAGIRTALVLTGVTDRSMLEEAQSPKPTHVLDSLADLL